MEKKTITLTERRMTVNIEWIPVEEEDVDKNGRAFISDGQLYIAKPLGNGDPALLVPGPNIIRMYLNGEIVREPITLQKGQRLEVVLPYKEPSKSLLLKISPSGLEASIATGIEEGLEYGLKDRSPSVKLELAGEVVAKIKPEPFQKEEVLAFLRENAISHGLLPDQISEFVSYNTEDYTVIAKGTPPSLPTDAKVDFKVKFETEKIRAGEDEIRVDYRKRFFIPSVDEGDLLAEKIPGKRGTPGKKVTGEIIPVKEPRDVELVVGSGARISGDMRYVYAERSGRPLCRNRQIVVEPVFMVSGDVDLKQGNVNFAGDVVITGGVSPNFEVNAGGAVNIRGDVVQAKVRSRSDMVIGGNIVSSVLIAASSQTPYPELTKIYAKIIFTLKKITAAVMQLQKAGLERNIKRPAGHYICQLIDLKFGELPVVVKRLQDVVVDPEDDLQVILKETNGELFSKLTGYGPRQIVDVEELNELIRRLTYLTRELEVRSKDTFADIAFPYAQNSQVEATGMVSIDRGCYYSNIISGQGIKFKEDGFFRGGTMVVFSGDINTGTVGSPAGAKTEITVVKKGIVTIKEVFPNVQVSINMRRYTFTGSYTDVKLSLNSEGQLEFEGLRGHENN